MFKGFKMTHKKKSLIKIIYIYWKFIFINILFIKMPYKKIFNKKNIINKIY